MLADYTMQIPISLQQFVLTIFEGVLALFQLEYFNKTFVHSTPSFNMEIL
jgi:hypothetical protein